jgi:hypothetical protein
MNPEQLKALMKELVQGITQVIASGEVLSDEFQGLLAQTLEALYQKIEQSSSQELPITAPAPPIQEGMPSSNVDGFAYDENNGKLYVRFLGKHPNRNGPIYSYDGVPPSMFELLRKGAVPARTDGQNKWGKWWKGKAPSLGASVYTLLKQGGFPYQKVA